MHGPLNARFSVFLSHYHPSTYRELWTQDMVPIPEELNLQQRRCEDLKSRNRKISCLCRESNSHSLRQL